MEQSEQYQRGGTVGGAIRAVSKGRGSGWSNQSSIKEEGPWVEQSEQYRRGVVVGGTIKTVSKGRGSGAIKTVRAVGGDGGWSNQSSESGRIFDGYLHKGERADGVVHDI